MANLQVKNFPDDLHEKLRDRARAEHVTVSAYLTRLVQQDLDRMTTNEWLEQVDKLPKLDHDIDIESLMDEVRDEIEGH